MDPFGIGMAGLGVAGLATFGAFGIAFRQRRRRLMAAPRSPADRLEALGAAQAELALRFDALARDQAPEERLQAMAGQLLGLIRDKNATLETALAGLDQLRARMRALEQMGEPAEARALVEALGLRLDALQAAQAASAAGLEARIEAAGGGGAADLAERLVRLQESRDAGLEAALARLGPLETRLAGLEAGREVAKRFEARLEALQGEQKAARTELAALKENPAFAEVARLSAQREALLDRLAALEERSPALDRLAERLEAAQGRLAGLEERSPALAEQLLALEARKDAGLEAVAARLQPLEAKLAALEARDPAAALAGLAARVEALGGRLGVLETAENPFGEISERLAALYAQKDATVETVFQLVTPLEARLATIEQGLGEQDPQAALDRFAERLEAVQGRVALLEENPFAEISERLVALYAQKDATVETVFQLVTPLEARLATLEGRDPQAALDRFAERLEAVQGRLATLEENPFAEISERLAGLYAQKDATVETVFARLAPLEAKLAMLEQGLGAQDPRALLDRFAERLEAVQGRLATLEENPFAEISERLAGLYAQKDAAVETVFQRLAPLEAKLAALEGRDPQTALDRFAERLEAVQGRVALLEENPFAEVSERLAGLYAQKDATVETVFARLAPLEAKLAMLEQGLGAQDPRALLDRFAERLEAVQGRLATLEENPFGEISERLAGLYAQKDATVETVFARLAPLEAKLAGVEQGLARVLPLAEDDPRAAVEGLKARLEALHWGHGEMAAGLAALQAEGVLGSVAEQLARLLAKDDLAPLEARVQALETRDPEAEAAREASAAAAQLMAQADAQAALFADRISALEASLPRADTAPSAPTPAAAPEPEIWSLPRVVSLHQK